MNSLDRHIDELASRQYGSLHRQQLVALGATTEAIRHRVGERRLVRGPFPRTYRHAAFETSWHGKLWALQLWAGPEGQLSHEAAGGLYELDGVPPGRLAVTLPKGRRNRHDLVPMHESVHPMSFPRTRDGLRITSPEATVVDLAWVLPRADADDALHSALRMRLTTVDRVAGVLDGRPGTEVMRELLERATGTRPRDSVLEGRFVRRAEAAGLRLVAQYEVRVDGRTYFLDFADPLRKVAIELDGFGAHSNRRRFQHDATRETLLQLAGWRVLHFTWDDLRDRPDWVIDCVRRALAG